MAFYTTSDYEVLKDMDIDALIDTLKLCYMANMRRTGYNGQVNYVGDGADYLAFAIAQATKQTIELLDACELFLENLGVDTDEGEY